METTIFRRRRLKRRHSLNQDHRSTTNNNNNKNTTVDSQNHHKSWNLHSVWDTALIETTLERDYGDQRSRFEDDLLRLLQNHPEWEHDYLSCNVDNNNDDGNDDDDDDENHRTGSVRSGGGGDVVAADSGGRRHRPHDTNNINNNRITTATSLSSLSSEAAAICVQHWGQESWQIALQYAYTKNIPQKEGGVVIEVTSGDELDEEYYSTRLPVVKERLVAGGVRLAAALERIFGG
jgi:hypothetical protein